MRNVLRRIRGRQRCRRPRIISRPFVLEPLEDRLLLSLTVGNIQVPLVGYDSTGRTAYDPVARLFQVTATPLLLKEANGLPSRRIEPGPAVSAHLDMRALVSHTGDLLGTVDGDDLVLTGSIDLDGDGVPDHSGVLLTGEAIGFGHLNLGLTDKFDLRFTLTGGALAGLYGGNDLGVVVTAENSTFNGSFSTAFTGGAKGSIGSLPRSGAAIYLEKRTESFDADDPDGPDVPHIAPPGAGTSAGDDDHGLVELWAGIGAIDAALVLGGRAATVLPWSTIDRIGARFDRPVDIGPADLQVAGVNVPRYAITGFDYDAVTHVATWALGAPISTDRVLVTLLGSHSVRFDVVPGDLDGDGAATVHDITHLRRGLEAPVAAQALPAHADINLDGAVSTLDVLSLRQNLGATLPHGEPVGSLAGTVTWTYEVLNTGSVPFALADVRVVDDNATPANAGDDFEPVLVAASDDGADGMLAPGETWLYTATRAALDLSADHPGVRIVPGCDPNGTGITRPTYENIARVTAGFVSDTDLSHYCNPAAPAIDIEKHTDGADADDPFGTDVPRIAPGAIVHWTFHVANTGNVPLAFDQVAVVDDQPGITPLLDGSSDVGADLMLAPGETWIYGASAAAADLVADPAGTIPGVEPLDPRPTHVNVARVTAVTAAGTVEDQDASHYANPDAPAIDIEKHTNGADADDAFGSDVPRIAPGAPVNWTFLVSNTGNVPFPYAAIDVADDHPAITPLLDGASDDGADLMLAPGETWIYRAGAAAGDLVADPTSTTPGVDPLDPRPTYVNVARVAALHDGISIEDQDASHYANPDAPAIDIEKHTNGADADDPFAADVPRIAPGAAVEWTFQVTNTGNIPFTFAQIEVTDDAAVAPLLDGASDGGADGVLAPGERWIYRAGAPAADLIASPAGTVPGIDPLDPRPTHVNIARVAATRGGAAVEDQDPSHYANPDTTGIRAQAMTNGASASDPFGATVPRIAVGATVTWTYHVTNSGNVALAAPVVTDDNGTPQDGADDFRPAPILDGDANVGDTNRDGLLDPGETWQYRHTGTALDLADPTVPTVPGQDALDPRATFENVVIAVTARANDIDPDAAAGADGADDGRIVASDLSHYGNPEAPAIHIESSTNGADADEPFGPDVPRLPAGETILRMYQVTNSGNAALSDVSVVDDNGTPTDLLDDFEPQPLLVQDANVGDADGDGRLDVGETWVFSHTLDSVDLIRDGVPTVPGIDPDRQRPTFRAVASATARRGSTIVQDTDQTHYANPDETAIAIEKTTNGADADDPFGADVPRIATGDAVTWTYHVTNGGNVPFWLDEITVTDDQSDVAPVFDPTSDVGGDEILSPGETWRYAATGTALALSDFPPAMQLGRTIGQTNVYPVLAGGAILTPAVFSFVVEGEGTILTSLALRLSIEHEYTDDLDVFLIAPDGTRHLIIDDVPGTNFQDTLLDDAADRSILDEEEGPHAGAFRPEGALSQFDGVDPNGTWLLQIFDDTPADDGVLFAPGQVASWGPVIGTQLLITSTNENPTTVPGCDPATPRSTYENLGTVLVAGGPSASDLSHYCNPAVSGLSVSRGVAAAASAGPAGEGGATPVTFVYAVGNTGETPLHDIHIYDDPRDGTSAVAFRPSALLAGSRNVGDVNGDGLLDLDETWLYTYTRSLGTGLFSSLVTVMARDPGGSLVATAAESFYLHL